MPTVESNRTYRRVEVSVVRFTVLLLDLSEQDLDPTRFNVVTMQRIVSNKCHQTLIKNNEH